MAPIAFSTPPHHVASEADLTPFTVAVPDAEIDRLKILLQNSPIAPLNRANSREDGSLGIPRKTLVALTESWKAYDW